MGMTIRARREGVARLAALGVLAAMATAITPGTEAAAAPQGPIVLVSANAERDDSGNDDSTGPAHVSDDGRYVVFTSNASDLAEGVTDDNGLGDVYLYDHQTQMTRLVSHAAGMPSVAADRGSSSPVLSADGRWVAYSSFATNIVAGANDTNNERDIFLYSVAEGTTTLVSHAAGTSTVCSGAPSVAPDISDDGAWLAYQSSCTDLVTGQMDTNGTSADVFLYERASNSSVLVSRPFNNATTTGDQQSTAPDISGQGNVVVYTTLATDISPATDANGAPDVGYYRRAVGNLPTTSTVLSLTPDFGATGNGSSSNPTVSDDGTIVAWQTDATNLTATTDINATTDVIVAEVPVGMAPNLSLASVDDAGTQAANAASFKPRVAGAGGHVAYVSFATNLPTSNSGQTGPGIADVILLRRADGVQLLASRAADGGAGDGDSGAPGLPRVGLHLSDDGRTVLYQSRARNLSPLDTVNDSDIYVYDASTDGVSLATVRSDGLAGTGGAAQPVLSSTGDYATFRSEAATLVASDSNGMNDIYAILGEVADTPTISIGDVSLPEGDSGTTPFGFAVSLDGPAAVDVTVDYATVDGTALAGDGPNGNDYEARSGTLTIPMGETVVTATVQVNGDTIPEPSERFHVVLSNPTEGYALDEIATTGTGEILSDDLDDLRDGVNDTIKLLLAGGDATNPNAEVAIRISQAAYESADGATPGQGGAPREALLANDAGFADALSSGSIQTYEPVVAGMTESPVTESPMTESPMTESPMTGAAGAGGGGTFAQDTSEIAGRPLLLTDRDELYPAVLTELQRLDIEVVNILGGEAAISDEVAAELLNRGYAVNRHAGPSRLETATAIAGNFYPAATTALLVRAFPAEGGSDTQAFADSLAAGAWAAERGWPTLFTQTEVLSTSTRTYLEGSSIQTVYVVGGSAAIDDTVIAALEEMGYAVIRVAGPSRFETALAIAEQRGFSDESDAAVVTLIDGVGPNAWAAGFAGAGLSALRGAPVLLGTNDQIPGPTADFLAPPLTPMWAVDEDAITGPVLVCGIAPDRCTEARSLLGLPDLASITEPEGSAPAGGAVQFVLDGGAEPEEIQGLLLCADSEIDSAPDILGAGSGSVTVTVPIPADTPTGPCQVKIKLIFPNGSEQLSVADIDITVGSL